MGCIVLFRLPSALQIVVIRSLSNVYSRAPEVSVNVEAISPYLDMVDSCTHILVVRCSMPGAAHSCMEVFDIQLFVRINESPSTFASVHGALVTTV